MEDEKNILLEEIKKELEELKEGLLFKMRGLATAPTTVILNSNNLIQILDPNQYYDVVIWLNGSPTSDIIVYLDSKVKENVGQRSYIRLNTTQNKYRLHGIRLSDIGVLESTIGSYSVYISYIGYYDYKQPQLSA